MDLTASSSLHLVQQLAAWGGLAREACHSSLAESDRPEVRALKRHLVRQHARQHAELQAWLTRNGAPPPAPLRPPAAWDEVIAAMRSRSRYVAVAACALLERAVITAYERAAARPWLEPRAMRLIRRHRRELLCCRDHYVLKLQGRRRRPMVASASGDALAATTSAPTPAAA